MKRRTISELKSQRLAALSDHERSEFDITYLAAQLAIQVGEKIRDVRESHGVSQRELATRMGTSQAAVARLEAGGVGSTRKIPSKNNWPLPSSSKTASMPTLLISSPPL
mgnify:CR=1 FL=1